MRSVPDVDTACRPVRIMRSVSWTESLERICRFVRYVEMHRVCHQNIRGRQREKYTVPELVKRAEKDEMFTKNLAEA